jgi:predicted small lipoprotein YifL
VAKAKVHPQDDMAARVLGLHRHLHHHRLCGSLVASGTFRLSEMVKERNMKKVLSWMLAVFLGSALWGCGQKTVVSTSPPNLLPTATRMAPTQRPTVSTVSSSLILFRNNFQDGNMHWWKVNGGWSIFQDGNAFYAASQSSGSAYVPGGLEWADYVLNAAYRLDYGGMAFDYLMSSSGRYLVLLHEEGIYLVRESPQGTLDVLAQAPAAGLGAWHWLEIASQQGHLQISLDRQVVIDVTDPAPLSVGTIGVSALQDAQASVDDILVTQRLSDLTTPATEPQQITEAGIQLPMAGTIVPDLAQVQANVGIPSQAVSTADLSVDASFTADGANQTTIDPGGCAFLEWNVSNSLGITLNDQAVVANGNVSVCPAVSTVYDLKVTDMNGSVSTMPITVSVSGVAHPDNTPDIAVTGVTVGEGTVGGTVPVSIRLTNNGTATAANFAVSIIPDASTAAVKRVFEVAQLPAGKSMTLSAGIPYSTPGVYNLEVRADCFNSTGDADVSNNSSLAEVTITSGSPPQPLSPGDMPGAPGNCQTSVVSDTAVQVTWVSGTNVTGYRIFNNTRTVATLPATSLTWIVDGLVPGTTYTFAVVSFNGAGTSAASACTTQATTNP